MLIVGIVLLVVSGILYFVRMNAQKKLFEIKSTETFLTKDLQDLYSSVKSEIGAGGFSKMAEVKGLVKCDNPLKGEISGQPCVYYSMTVTREFEETKQERDANGNMVTKNVRGSETVSSNTQRVPFYVQDESGRMLVNPNNANIDPVQVKDEFQAGEYQTGQSLSFGGFTFTVNSPLSSRRTLGYRFQESILPLDRKVYILGEVTDTSGELAIQYPREKGKKYIISLKSEEELVRGAESTIKWTLYAAIACDVIGIVLVILGVLKK
jgi:hypothetical protein